MKVIFLHDVPRQGKKYEVKEVSDGFVKNFLFPRKLVEVATDKALARLELTKKSLVAEKEIQDDLLEKNFHDINGVTLTMKEKANEQGHLFAGIHKEEISKALAEASRLSVKPEMIMLEEPIRELGEFSINIVVKDKKAKITLKVEGI
ncbi:MAG: large subunit ribosomal protein L9 [Parcubacteria group bacterium LiPW_30]|nr:MAG: large subunit ribosomal protein L9 [Parcubacteria group bacterium LiPW_30]